MRACQCMTAGGPSLRRSLQYVRHRPARRQPRIRRGSAVEEADALVTTMAEVMERAAISAMTAPVAAACVAAEPPLRQAAAISAVAAAACKAAECGALVGWRMDVGAVAQALDYDRGSDLELWELQCWPNPA